MHTPRVYSFREIIRTLISLPTWHALRTHYIGQEGWEASRRSRKSEQFGHPVPWWPYSAVSFVQQMVPTSARILEIGAGNSSLWWALRGNRTTAIEDSAEWASSLVVKASAELIPLEIIEANIDECDPSCLGLDHDFDVLVVDHSGDRPKAIEKFLPFLKPDSFVILDNSDRAEYASAREFLLTRGYQVVDFFGLGPINAFGTLTSVFFKQALSAQGIHIDFHTVAN